MSGKALVDTNVVIALFAGEPNATGYLNKCSELFLCVPVLGELWYGASASTRIKENLQRVEGFAKTVLVLSCDPATTAWYGEVKVSLRKKGRLIPDNDIWIAAIARQYKLKVVSRDSHFTEVDGLDVEIL